MKFIVTYIKELTEEIEAEDLRAACEIAEKKGKQKKAKVYSVFPQK